MGKNYFTEEQQSELRKNPYIQKVSAKSITYTKEFKENFQEEYRAGKLPSQILSDMGIDHHMLGKRRKDGFVAKMKVYELRPEGFEDIRKNHSGRPATKQLTDVEKIKRLELKITYLNQENEFLKKNIQMDRQANWEYKRKHPSNTSSLKK
ncbi:HTH domain-containing protein [Clostridium sp. CF012]|uniref:HTH domain-containing protein n=1 Tax=Clostridium sp. CF012 TaxID=2843319 RepID=UPI001C0D935B|nr:HTH domain-containing protein [Clostridium sp. CF012]MBU3146993.1 transposase [Clostridium sp. CF012]